MTIELVTTDGIFALDGGEWAVTNNIWLVGDDSEVLIFDAAHDHQPIVDGRERPQCHRHRPDPRPQRPHQRRRGPARRRRCADHAARVRPLPVGRRLPRPRLRRAPRTRPHDQGRRSRTRDPAHARATPPDAAVSTTSPPVPCSAATPCSAVVPVRRDGCTPTSRRSCATIRNVLLTLPDQTVVHTGHGDSTSIGAERDGVLARAAELGL